MISFKDSMRKRLKNLNFYTVIKTDYCHYTGCMHKQEKDGDLKILEDDVQNTSLQARKTKATIGISIKSGANNLTKKLASSEKSYLLASFFKTPDHDRSGEHEQAYSTDDSDLVVKRINVRKKRIKEALTEYSPSTSNSNNDFAILSKDELDKF